MTDEAAEIDPIRRANFRDVGGAVVRTVVVTVGDEILIGDTVDTNAARVGRVMGELGAPVIRRETVGDTVEAISGAVRRALADGDLVLVTGGLGPTPDDLTREAVAALMGTPLAFDHRIAAALRARFQSYGYQDFPEGNLRQAMVPEGARVLPNALGTAPGLALERAGRWLVLLPGVPRELDGLLGGPVAELVREAFGARLNPPRRLYVHTTGIPESRLAQRVEALLPRERGPVQLAYLPSLHGVTLRFTVPGDVDPRVATVWLDRMEGALGEIVRYRYDGSDLVAAVAGEFERSGRRVAVAESCTGGLLAKRMTDRPGSSRWFLGGVVAYADAAKVSQLGANEELIARVGAVSDEVARELAEGAARVFGAEAGVGITGIAGPDGGTPDKPVGTVCYAVALDGVLTSERRVFAGDREAVRERSAQAALHLLYRALIGRW